MMNFIWIKLNINGFGWPLGIFLVANVGAARAERKFLVEGPSQGLRQGAHLTGGSGWVSVFGEVAFATVTLMTVAVAPEFNRVCKHCTSFV